MKISAILLSAGLSLRMGEDKLLLDYSGASLFERAIALLAQLPVYERIVVTTKERCEKVNLPSCVRVVLNHNPQIGQSESIRLGVSDAQGTHFMFLVADQPKLSVSALEPILNVAQKNPDKIVFPIVCGKPSSPAIFPARFKDELLALSGDMGGRDIRRAFPELCFGVEVQSPCDFVDIDDLEDYNRLNDHI
ncbi:MAG: NTP transferase domain-containing protein [Oscillospiraceae bacterium]|nr:NTP transferase domain-containing protein [Oscillospiraceae bacterium]